MTKFDICNMALVNIGITRPISNFTDNSTEATVCGRFYNIAKELVLTGYKWKFANIYGTDLLTLTDETSDKYQFVYEYPDDALRVIAIGPDGNVGNFDYPFEIISSIGEETGETTKRIMSDVENAKANYLIDIDESVMPAAFVEALSWKLSSMVATGLSKTPQAMQFAMQMYSNALNQAKYQNDIEGVKEPIIPKYIRARFGILPPWRCRHGNF